MGYTEGPASAEQLSYVCIGAGAMEAGCVGLSVA